MSLNQVCCYQPIITSTLKAICKIDGRSKKVKSPTHGILIKASDPLTVVWYSEILGIRRPLTDNKM